MPPNPHREPTARAPLHIDGTTLEGGGQILRLATGLSALTGLPIHITDIRGNRSRGGGLKAQHLTAVQWLGRASRARVKGLGLKSREIVFRPGRGVLGGRRGADGEGVESAMKDLKLNGTASRSAACIDTTNFWDIRQDTPGSVNLVFQALLPYILFSGSEKSKSPVTVRITGGTNVSNSPSYEYFDQVLFPVLEKIGIPRIERKMIARGWSQGGAAPQIGCVEYAVTPLARPLPAFQLTDRGRVERVHATVLAPRDAEARFCDMLRNAVSRNKGVIFGDGDADLASTAFSMSFEDSGHARRYYVLLVATTTTGMKLGRDCLYQGPSGLTQEHIIKQAIGTAVRDLATEIRKGGCVDEHLRDQLVVFQGLAEGRSRVFGGREPNVAEERLAEPNLHAKTARWVLTEMLGVVFDEDGSCEGVGHRPGAKLEEEYERVG